MNNNLNPRSFESYTIEHLGDGGQFITIYDDIWYIQWAFFVFSIKYNRMVSK